MLDSGILVEADVSSRCQPAGGRDRGWLDDRALRNAGTRGAAVERMRIGVRSIALRLYAERRIDGVVALEGGGQRSGKRRDKALPLVCRNAGVPHRLGATALRMFTGRRTYSCMHSVVDILGLNAVSSQIFDNAAAAIAGMATSFARQTTRIGEHASQRKQIAATMLGNTTRPLMIIRKALADRGYDLVIFHANGVGGAAMEELIEQIICNGVIDFTLSELPGNSVGWLSRRRSHLWNGRAKGIPR